MNTNAETISRHHVETAMLVRAIHGDIHATHKALKYLGSITPGLRQVMKEAIHDLPDPILWRKLLHCLADRRWDDQLDCEWRSSPEASRRIDQAILEVFIEDETELEKASKEAALYESLVSEEPELRAAAAFILAYRGDIGAIPTLEWTIDHGTIEWKVNAIHALAALQHENCGHPLVKALAMDRGILHKEAHRALTKLGKLAAPAWLAALNDPDMHIRWHAARGLGDSGNASVCWIVAEGLYDSNQAVRWASADTLARLGAGAIPAILTVLSHHEVTEPFRQAAYHALHSLSSNSKRTQAHLYPLLKALQGAAFSIEAPVIAQHLLLEWDAT